MGIKEIINAKDGNEIESLIFKRIQRHIFMLYSMRPLQNISFRLLSVIDCKYFRDGIYIYMTSEHIDFLMHLPKHIINRMIAQEFYTPFHEDNIKPFLEKYIKEVEEYKNLKTRGIHIKNNCGKVLMQIYFKRDKKSLLKRILGGLQLW